MPYYVFGAMKAKCLSAVVWKKMIVEISALATRAVRRARGQSTNNPNPSHVTNKQIAVAVCRND